VNWSTSAQAGFHLRKVSAGSPSRICVRVWRSKWAPSGAAKSHGGACQPLGNKRITVEVAVDVEREIASDPHAHRPHDRVELVPVVVQELFAALSMNR
jgi:hypothetical protein